MHRIIGGLVSVVATVLACVASPARAQQITGKVESIGFDGTYRPGCWTPMLVTLSLTGGTPGNYELRVYQHDLDGDLPYYTRPISLSGNGATQSFWTCFLPEPVHGGMSDQGTTLPELAAKLRVSVFDAAGRELAQVPVTNTASSVDPTMGSYETGRASRLVIFVGTSAAPPMRDYTPVAPGSKQTLLGVKEDLNYVRLAPERLPEMAVAYEGVDAIVWLEGDPSELERGGGQRLTAIRDYVRRGGHLVLCTPTQWQQLLGFGDLMPVDISGTEENRLQSPVRDLTDRVPFTGGSNADPDSGAPQVDPWTRFRDPFTIATATPRPGAVVDLYADRVANAERPEDRTPWLVRKPYGFGCVTWVGQDLGDRKLTERANWGWPAVWETVLGSASQPGVYPNRSYTARFRTNQRRDLGFSILEGLNLTGRAAQLIGLTILFFIGYWLVAGPGTYFWLRYRGKSSQNWFVFGVLAVGATGLTLLLVRLVLRGSPEVRHVSLVRVDMADPTDPAFARSRFGMYIPRDGAQRIALAGADLNLNPSVSPYPIHPTLHAARNGDAYLYAAPREYRINVPMGDTGESAEAAAAAGRSSAVADVPFRTTMKRLQAEYAGARSERITGTPAILPPNQGYIGGVLHNESGHDLHNVFIAFRHQTPGNDPTDWMMFVANWKNGDQLDLTKSFNPQGERTIQQITVGRNNDDARLNADFPVRGWMSNWRDYFSINSDFQGTTLGVEAIQVTKLTPQVIAMLSFFNRLPPIENDTSGGNLNVTRADLYRSGLRDWDISLAEASGRLVVVAQADDAPIPAPLEVEGEKIEGSGTTIYQFTLPLTPIPEPPRSPATTQATTSPVR